MVLECEKAFAQVSSSFRMSFHVNYHIIIKVKIKKTIKIVHGCKKAFNLSIW